MQRIYRYPINSYELFHSNIELEEFKNDFIEKSKESFIKEYNIDPDSILIDVGLQDNFIDGCTYIYVELRGKENAK